MSEFVVVVFSGLTVFDLFCLDVCHITGKRLWKWWGGQWQIDNESGGWPLADDSESGGVGTGKNLCSIQSSFCQSDKHKSQTPSRLQAH